VVELSEADRALSIATDGLDHPVEYLADEAGRGRELRPVQHFHERNSGDEDAEGWLDQPNDRGHTDGTEEPQRSRPIDLYRAESTDEALIFLGHGITSG
jgi:hypothetical protein